MRKILVYIISSILILFTFVFSSCGDDSNGTYFPTNEEMKTNLENNGYTVEYYDDLNYHEFFVSFDALYEGTLIQAGKGDEYIYFFWLSNSWQCGAVYDIMNEKCESYNALVKIENDEKFGNIVYCGTIDAIEAAGIKVVEVDVKV